MGAHHSQARLYPLATSHLTEQRDTGSVAHTCQRRCPPSFGSVRCYRNTMGTSALTRTRSSAAHSGVRSQPSAASIVCATPCYYVYACLFPMTAHAGHTRSKIRNMACCASSSYTISTHERPRDRCVLQAAGPSCSRKPRSTNGQGSSIRMVST